MAEEPIYGAFGDILNIKDEEEANKPVTYNLYENRAFTPSMDLSSLQDVYGTSAMPIFEWVRTVQTGQRTYNPGENPVDDDFAERYRELIEKQGQPPGFPTFGEIIGETATSLVQPLGVKIGESILNPGQYLTGGAGKRALSGAADALTFSSSPYQIATSAKNKLLDASMYDIPKGFTALPDVANKSIASETGNLALHNKLSDKGRILKDAAGKTTKDGFKVYSDKELASAGVTVKDGVANAKGANLSSGAITSSTAPVSYLDKSLDKLSFSSTAGKANWASSAGTAGIGFIVGLASGQKPVEAAKSAGGAALGQAIGTAFGGPIGGFVGSVIGGALGGRVICNELMRQGIMDRKQVILDYKFTKEHLTPQHVLGYHIWAVFMVKQMRKGRLINFWSHVAGHRANEIAYIYGERDKPDYLGKLYRKILEPSCWVIGAFCKQTDWSILYKKKEI